MNDILDKKMNLIKRSVIANLLLIPCWILSFFISVNATVNLLPMLELMTLVLKIDYIDRYMFLNVIEFLFKYLPTIVYVSGKVYIFNINKEIRKLDREYDFELLEEIQKNEKKDLECVVIDEEEIRRVYDIVERFEKLPRGKQIEILNYIKGDLELYDKDLASEIDLIGDKYRECLMIECEDILFPNIEDGGYSKKKEK